MHNTEQEQFVDAYENHIIYQMGKLDFNPLITTIKTIRANVADICGSQRETAAIKLDLHDILFSNQQNYQTMQIAQNQLHQKIIDEQLTEKINVSPYRFEHDYQKYILGLPVSKEIDSEIANILFQNSMILANWNLISPAKILAPVEKYLVNYDLRYNGTSQRAIFKATIQLNCELPENEFSGF